MLGNFTELARTFTVIATPADWRQFYFGTAENAGAAADLADPDGDGDTNFFEYVAGLSPRDPQARFKVRVAPVDGQPNRKQITFGPMVAGRTYTLKYKTSETTWVPGSSATNHPSPASHFSPSPTDHSSRTSF